jgi:DMSO reductase anchor subunit
MSTLTLGGICILFLFLLTDIKPYFNTNTVIDILCLIVMVSLLLNLSGYIFNLLSLPNLGLSGIESYKIITENFTLLLYARIILSVISLLLLLYVFITIEKNHCFSIIFLITLLIFISEIIGRFLFYSSYSRVGI